MYARRKFNLGEFTKLNCEVLEGITKVIDYMHCTNFPFPTTVRIVGYNLFQVTLGSKDILQLVCLKEC